MKICGIVCEYNPFHYGHLYHIQEARKKTNCDLLICVMSGNVCQRGEFTICDKWERAQTAILHGADLVIELPSAYVTQSADQFAYGAIQSLALAGVDTIIFGSESDHRAHLESLLQKFEQRKNLCTNTISFAKKLELILDEKLSSNDILGLFYIKEAKKHNIAYDTILRTNNYHDLSLTNKIASASAIRNAFYQDEDIANYTPMNSSLFSPYTMEHYYPYLQTLIATLPTPYLSQLFMVDEGIEYLFKKQIHSNSYHDFVNACTSKRYTKTRIQRTIMQILTQTTKEEINSLPPLQHIRVLAFNQKGQSHLKTLKNKDVIIASHFSKIPKPYRELEYRIAHCYAYPYSQEEKQRILEKERSMPRGRVSHDSL